MAKVWWSVEHFIRFFSFSGCSLHRSGYLSLFTYILFFLYSNLFSQEPVFKNYTTEDGLSSNEVYCVMQDSKGFIWFGTDGGVSRFDGYRFKNFTSADGLTDNTIFEIQEDKRGRIWFRTLSGKICYSYNDSIVPIDANDRVITYLKSDLLSSFFIDSGDTLWCSGRSSGGVVKISPPYRQNNLEIIDIKDKGPFLFFIEEDNFVHGINRGKPPFHAYNFYRKNKLLFETSADVIDYFNIRYSSNNGTLCLSDDNDLRCIKDGKPISVMNLKKSFNSMVLFIKQIDDHVWMGLRDKGVVNFLFPSGSPVSKYTQLLGDYSVSNVIKDSEGGMWFSTLENGVYYTSPNHFTMNGKNGNEKPVKPSSFSVVTENAMLVTYKQDFVNLVLKDTVTHDLRFSNSPELNSLFSQKDISFPMLIKTGNNQESGNHLNYLSWGSKKGFVLLRRKNNSPVSIYLHAVDVLNKKVFITDRYKFYEVSEKPIFDAQPIELPARAFDMVTDHKGIVWIGTLNGLWSYDKRRFIHHKYENSLLNSRINKILITEDGTRFFATLGNGLIINKDNRYYNVTMENGLVSNNCECLCLDSYKRLWIGTKSGICSIDLQNGQEDYSNLLVSNGELLGKKINQIAQCGNTLWVNTSSGLVTHELPVIDSSIIDPPVYITEYFVNDRSYSPHTGRKFAYFENNIKISYVGLHYKRFGKLNYEYKLEGVNSNWTRSQSTTVQYPYLLPGKYTFYVRIASDRGSYKNMASINFTIEHPLWEKLWFRLLVSVFIIAVVSFLFLYRINKIKKTEKEKTRINKQIAEIEMKALRAQMNPHFIFNAMNSVQNFILKNERMLAQDYLAKFARLVRNVLDNSKAEIIGLDNEMETLTLYMQLEQLRIPDKFSFNIQMDEKLEVNKIMIPPMLIQPFVENAILHGLKNRHGNDGKIKISIGKEKDQLVCIVDDNGIGRKRSKEIKLSRNNLHRSFGLEVTEERIDILNSQADKSASIEIRDKEDVTGNSAGTRVTIKIPFTTQ